MLKVKSIKPMFTSILTTTNRYTSDNTVNGGVLIDNKKLEGNVKEYQTVVKIGPSVREVQVGDVVLINPSRYMKKKFDENSLRNDIVDNPTVEINIPTVQMNDEEYFMIQENDVAYIIEDSEEVADPVPSSIIVPKKANIIL